MITEPDVTLTDYGLAFECAVFTVLVFKRGHRSAVARWFALFFGSLSLGALLGGTVHGFFADESSRGYKILWPVTLIAIGLTALSSWGIASRMLFSRETARRISLAAGVLFVCYVGIVIFVNQTYLVSVLDYLPPAVFLIVAWSAAYRRSRAKPVLIGVLGLVLTFVAAGVQQEKVDLHPVFFDHNAFYHLIQAVALFMMFLSARWFISEGSK